MADTPQDPSQNTINQEEHHRETYDGQKGYGVEYEGGRYQSEDMQDTPDRGRSGSYETGTAGGYGSGEPALPPDPEAQQGQGGQ